MAFVSQWTKSISLFCNDQLRSHALIRLLTINIFTVKYLNDKSRDLSLACSASPVASRRTATFRNAAQDRTELLRKKLRLRTRGLYTENDYRKRHGSAAVIVYSVLRHSWLACVPSKYRENRCIGLPLLRKSLPSETSAYEEVSPGERFTITESPPGGI